MEPEFYRFVVPGSTKVEEKFYSISIACKLPAGGGQISAVSPCPGISGIIPNLMQLAEKTITLPTFDEVKTLAEADVQAVDDLIRSSLKSDVVLVSQVSEYIVTSGGKRLRPLIVLLAARALGYQGVHHIHAAAIVEFIHTATLLHDDVVDSSDRRRGRDTANTVFGNQASVLVGDFLYSRAFQMMVDIGQMPVMRILADATNTIAAGEVMQLMNVHDPDITEENYRQVIYRKTARLFEAGAQIAAVLAGRHPGDEAAMMRYGQNLGTAFQLVDDALDYVASPEELGKNLGDDLAEGKATLPIIYSMQNGTPAERDLIRSAIEDDSQSRLEDILAVIHSTGALEYTSQRAQEAASSAMDALRDVPESEYKQALLGLAEFSVQRRS
jgi:octaprenyl-diphosphate synthase